MAEDAESALPHNLSDYWLKRIARDLEMILESDSNEKRVSECLIAPLFLIPRICEHKAASRKHNQSTGKKHGKMYKCFRDYLIEVALECISQDTNIKAEPATLETIFTERRVGISREAIGID